MAHCKEVRLDISADLHPDIVADMSDLPDGIGPFDAVFTAHALEHLYPHDVDRALAGFQRVLKPGGSVVILVPDLEGVAPTWDVLYESEAGPVCGHDLYYGYAKYLAERPYMAHRSGFVASTLQDALERAGFESVKVERLKDCYVHNLFGFGRKRERTGD